MEITSSSVSVYEVVLDLEQWRGLRTNEIPGFAEALIRFLPSTALHKCVAGRVGGFHEELLRGTNLAHVVEHVLLEFIHLADPARREFSGWTKEQGNGVFKIHYGAPGFLEGRLAPILATDAVRRLQAGVMPDLEAYLADMCDPQGYFARNARNAGGDTADQTGHVGRRPQDTGPSPAGQPAPLTIAQRQRLALVFDRIEDLLPRVEAAWRGAFFAFGGEFARGIVDKVEILNPDRFAEMVRNGDVDAYLDGVTGLSAVIRTLRIPLTFVTHAAWLYKSQLQLAVMEVLDGDPVSLSMAVGDLDDLYGNLLRSIMAGYSEDGAAAVGVEEPALRDFRARQVRPSRVLVVDDDVMSRRAVCDILEYRGIATIGVGCGLEALRALETHRFAIAVVVLDLVLPGLDGLTVCRRIRAGYPQVRVVLSSGYPLGEDSKRCLIDHEVCFLGKPFESASLVAMVRDMLDLDCVGARAVNG